MKGNFGRFSKDICRIKKENCTWKPLKDIKYSVHRDKNATFTKAENLRLSSSKNGIYSNNNLTLSPNPSTKINLVYYYSIKKLKITSSIKLLKISYCNRIITVNFFE